MACSPLFARPHLARTFARALPLALFLAPACIINNGDDDDDDDAGAAADDGGAAADAGAAGTDAGATGIDAGTTAVDAGGTGADAGNAGADAGAIDTDGGAGGDAGEGTDAGPAGDGGQVALECDETFAADDACGGDLQGVWTVEGACVNDQTSHPSIEEIKEDCPSLTAQATGVAQSGTLTVSGSTYAFAVTGTVDFDLFVPDACASLLGGCAGLAFAIDGDCTAVTGGCDCEVTADTATSDNGTLSVSSGVVTLDTGATYYFCVDGDGLTYREFDNDVVGPVVVSTR